MFLWLYTLASVLAVSLISLIGLVAFITKVKTLNRVMPFLVGFSAGGLFGDTFIHLLPEATEEIGFDVQISLTIIFGILVSFTVERFLQWRHCHIPTSEEHPHPFAYMNLFGDAVHNFIDGLIIGGSYLSSIPLGIATTLAVAFHEIPQEIGDCGVLLQGGFDKSKAILFNFASALIAVLGALTSLSLSSVTQELTPYLIPFAAGSFIYIAGSDLIPQLQKDEPKLLKSALQLISLMLGALIMLSLIILE
jgi:zinc and cadmium transporter